MALQEYRIEKDSMGEVKVPKSAYYGAQTQRAVENFPVSGIGFPPRFIRALAIIKHSAATANEDLKLLDPKIADVIRRAAFEVMEGKLDREFVVDIFQTGSGTSTNMNANEVIANRALELLGKERGSKGVHPNDHVNMSQSSNDVIPTAIHVSALEAIQSELLPALGELHLALKKKAQAFDRIVKIGRTHLADATPIRLGQEFSGYARQIELSAERIRKSSVGLEELALGGTAVGTGINTHPEFPAKTIKRISEMTGLNFREAENHFEAQAAKDAVVEVSGSLKTLAVSLSKIANDLRWLSSGPRCGIGEISLPDTQPGSSIMPGKVNPVMCESVLQVAAHVIGCDATITLCGQAGNFELNVMMPVMALRLLEAITFSAKVVRAFTEKCVMGIEANRERCEELIEKSLAMVTSLAPVIGYDAAAKIAKEAFTTGKTVREVAKTHKVLPEDKLDKILDPWRMTEPGIPEKE
ncbi:MAG: aspartate ammonia-lyase [Deltaproteobacteria bacterium RIFCSPLOWO2_12_FULL_57_22]|nr:MAG: aspartate ammonia-lyase [Deltaproteobacteria bacterium RIFCSPLOWO2_12_FULL_57_22]